MFTVWIIFYYRIHTETYLAAQCCMCSLKKRMSMMELELDRKCGEFTL